jgi:hypothetical protein
LREEIRRQLIQTCRPYGIVSPVPGLNEDLHESTLTLVKGLVELCKLGDIEPVGDEELGRPSSAKMVAEYNLVNPSRMTVNDFYR